MDKEEFSRTRLLLGAEAMDRLAAARVAVFGLGGVGGQVAETFIRCGVGALDFFGQNPAEVTLALRDIDMASLGSEDDEMFGLLSENRLPEG